MAFRDKKVRLILSNYDIGAGKKGAAAGTIALQQELQLSDVHFGDPVKLNSNGVFDHDTEHPYCKHIDSVTESAIRLNDEVVTACREGYFPLIFSGDHSNAIGGLSGLRNANPDKRIGVIWVDAHADLHSPYTTPSGNMHGMPLAVLTGNDNTGRKKNPVSGKEDAAWQRLKAIGEYGLVPKVKASDIVFIGIRDAEAEEWGLIDDNKILCFGPDDLKEHGIYYALNKALAQLSTCDLIYVSFDADSVDPSIANGTGTPSPDGLTLNEAEAVFSFLMKLPNLGAFEITEINPSLDSGERKMARVMADLLKHGLGS